MKWDRRFLELARHVASWSKDTTKVGAVIVNPTTKQVVGLGYNGFPRGVEDTDDRYQNHELKLKLVCHAEVNAILNANSSVRGCDIYVWPTMMIPAACPDCSKAIVQSGIKKLLYYNTYEVMPDRWRSLSKFSQMILKEGGVEIGGVD